MLSFLLHSEMLSELFLSRYTLHFSLRADTGDLTHLLNSEESENSSLLVPEKHVIVSRLQALAR